MPEMRQIYLLDPQKLSSETIAVSFAKTSRSPHSFRDIAAELSDEKSSQFHEKWVVGYGHSSVAEHAVLHIAIENISRLAVETLQSNRLASYTEKSTRYQKWDRSHFYIPKEFEQGECNSVFQETCEILFDTYEKCLERLLEFSAIHHPRSEDESHDTWQRRIHSRCTDACRFLLPACSIANVGMTINARSLEYAISKMLSSPLDEVRAIGEEIKSVALQSVPTLVKYADASDYFALVENSIDENIEATNPHPFKPETIKSIDWLVSYACQDTQEIEDRILAAILYRFSSIDYTQCLSAVRNLNPTQRSSLVRSAAQRKNKFQALLREFEYATFSFDAIMDQGAYYEFKRHRMMSQTPQSLNASLGYAMPRFFSESGLEETYRQAMQTAQQAYFYLAKRAPHAASYIVPNAFNRRVFFSLNLRSAFHIINLRTAANAHFSIRRIALRLAEEISLQVPSFAPYLQPQNGETWQDIETRYFSSLF